ncbi:MULTISPECIES: hypothetical protein [unclassified Rhizobium]|uniref:hypothetical protein n=1 Tax=unclassified Rhizobium TaxID=2613769 RepID=UPI0006FF2A90|nr:MULTISPECIES: hypothetical protein [unclassified Rhizobium]KQV42692.1 hypothetical protein ASC86_18680 [Rhizobium sp. Root1212]KRD36424.1 hypothetical protein ASE37_19665 [Rhizobium sp. Root268]
MRMRKVFCTAIAGFAMLAADNLLPMPFGPFVPEAQAIVGRPATPGSVAGVARRTTRRVIRRSTIYVAALPAGCVRTSVNGAVIWRCGGAYYQPYNGRYVVVYID